MNQKKFIKKNLSDQNTSKGGIYELLYVLFCLGLLSISLGVFIAQVDEKVIKGTDLLHDWKKLFNKFTYQSNFLVLIVMLLFFTPWRKKKNFAVLTFITLVSILFTAIINHSILDRDEIKNFSFKTVDFQHTIIPLLYTVFYFSKKNIGMSCKKAYLGIIHPLTYLIIYLIIGKIKGEDYKYPYDFINPHKPGIIGDLLGKTKQGYFYLFLTASLLTVLTYLFSLFLNFAKSKINSRKY
ncbi:hypothetical protein [Vaccinium witches'-broom phytoplasma]|uniref:hypothetical protein n=1 Tax=Vaccinium witches'-broom phytoplasma TaxID=85642 RepID=UPI000375D066|nr:hypothetical protein [Vaccinium witches'-broom phytoplasma]